MLWLQLPAAGHPDKVFVEFDPLPLKQHAGKPSLAFDTFDAALDAFFAKACGCLDLFLWRARQRASLLLVSKSGSAPVHHRLHI